MLKAAAMLMIAAAFAVGGFAVSAFHAKKAAVISNIILMINIIETQLRYACLPVPELLKILGENEVLAELSFIKCVRERVCFGEAFHDAWSKCVFEDSELCALLGKTVPYLARLGGDIGASDLESQLSCCEYYRRIFEDELKIRREKSGRYTKLFPPLGLLAGVTAAILIV